MLLTLIFAEAALELVPKDLWTHPTVRRHSKRRGKHPRFILLDRSYHHKAMIRLGDAKKRGRPDIIHFSLLEALSSPLNKAGHLQTYVHTVSGDIMYVNSEIRLPKNYMRFIGLVEQLFNCGEIRADTSVLLTLKRKTLKQLLKEVNPTHTMLFSRKGKLHTLEEAVLKISSKLKPAVIIGGFPHGKFSDTTIQLSDEIVSVDPGMLETWTLTSRVIYEYERAISLTSRRILSNS